MTLSPKPTGNSQSLQRGLEILLILDQAAAPVGIREIARQLELSATIVQRLINTLAHNHFVTQDPETRRYSIGYRALGLGWSLTKKDRLISVAKPELDMLATKHLLNGYLGIQRGLRAVYILSAQSEGPIVIRSVPGSETYLHSTALGKVLLAGLADDEVERLLRSERLEQVTPKTCTDPKVLLKQIQEVRDQGYAVITGENISGVVSVGAPIRDASERTVAALSTAFAEWASPEFDVAGITILVRESATRISRMLGSRSA
ncbi:IclR family transcriptional regulator [Mesorhizobium australicum]|uniref:Transcriptional regulator, IclR family n=1 Tax=Mesorhizobium australicum TaxID=536018 RepID=A0A1X7MX40_9HYPH|nr:IclR family transcriptional regulator [Mesorhizobium australicum]SMH29476.1 transcriptional regulator, IclR family [Mesorhizobium australicum]